MTNFIPLNFTQAIAPAGGAAISAASAPQSGILGGAAGGTGGLLTGSAPASAPVTTDIFNLLLGQGNILPNQEKISAGGKNLPGQDLPVDSLNTPEQSINALQSVLTGLVAQQVLQPQANATQGASGEIIGGESTNQLIGGITQRGGLSDGLGQAQAQGSINNVADTGVQGFATTVANRTSVFETVQNVVGQQGKTLDAYRSAAALNLPAVGSTLDAPDAQALNAALALPKAAATPVAAIADAPQLTTQPNATAASLLKASETGVSRLTESIKHLSSLSAATPLPQIKANQGVGTLAEGNKPLDQIASLQAALAGAKLTTERVTTKLDNAPVQAQVAQATQTATANAVAVPQAGQQLSQEFTGGGQQQNGQNSAQLAAAAPAQNYTESEEVLNNPNAALRADSSVKAPAHDFAQHLSKAPVVTPAEQIAVKIAQLPEGKQHVTVQLDPADLGKVDVKLEWAPDGRSQISILAERRETLEMLKSDISALQRSLGDSGIKTDSAGLQFGLKGQEGQMAQDGKQSNGQQASADGEGFDLKETIEQAAVAAKYVNLNNLLDVRV